MRELENRIRQAVILADGVEIGSEDLALDATDDDARGAGPRSAGPREAGIETMELEILERCGWKVSGPGGAAEVLDLKPTTLEAKMRKLGIRRP